MRCFFSVSDPPAPVRYFILYRRVFEIQPTSSERAASYCVNAARFLNVASQARGDIAHFSDFFALGFCLNSDYSISAARARCANKFSRRFTLLLVLFRAFVQ